MAQSRSQTHPREYRRTVPHPQAADCGRRGFCRTRETALLVSLRSRGRRPGHVFAGTDGQRIRPGGLQRAGGRGAGAGQDPVRLSPRGSDAPGGLTKERSQNPVVRIQSGAGTPSSRFFFAQSSWSRESGFWPGGGFPRAGGLIYSIRKPFCLRPNRLQPCSGTSVFLRRRKAARWVWPAARARPTACSKCRPTCAGSWASEPKVRGMERSFIQARIWSEG